MKEVFSLRLSDSERKELEEISKEENESIGKLIRESIDRLIIIKRFKQLRRRVLPFAEAQGLLTDEDVFQALEK